MPLDYYSNTEDIDLTQGEVRAQYYTPKKLKLLNPVNGYLQSPSFGISEFDRVELHVYDINKKLIVSNHKVDGWSVDTDKDGAPQANVNINEDLRNAGFNQGVFSVVYNFHRDAAGAPIGPKFKIETISKSRTEVRLIATELMDEEANDDLLENFYSRFQKLKTTSTVQAPYNVSAIPNNPLWTNMSINFGFNRIHHITAWVIDDIFPLTSDQPETILLKLLNPLPLDLKADQIGWLIAEATQPAINRVQLDSEIEFPGNTMRGANFDLCLDDTPRVQSDYKSYNDILGGDTDVKSNLLNNYSSSLDGVRLNIDYSIMENFVHFSSAESRINNFIYKLKQIRNFDTQARKYDYSEYPTSDIYIYEYTGSHGSKYVKKYQKTWVDKKVNLINNFDDFEKWMYFESGSRAKYTTTSGSRGGGDRDWSRSSLQPYPKLSGSFKNDLWTEDYLDWNLDQLFDWAVHSIFIPGPNYELLSLTNTESSNWIVDSVASSSAFDKQNPNLLQKTVPEYLSDTGKVQNETYLRFLDLVGQSHDVSWTYTKYFTRLNSRLQNTNFENKVGVSDDAIYHIGKSYGIDLVEGDPNQDLWQYRLGQNSEGVVIQNHPTSSIKTLTSKQRTAEVWKRLVTNLPFLLKSKGTAAGVRGIINCYGIPEHILPITEYGSSKRSEQTTRYKDSKFSYCLNFSSQSIATPWASHKDTVGIVTSSATTPNAVELRVWPNPANQAINNIGTSFSQSLWQVNNDMGIVLHRSHSNVKKINGQPEGLTEFGHFELVMSQSRIVSSVTQDQMSLDGYVHVNTGKAKIFEKTNKKESGRGWWTLLLNRKAGSRSNVYHSSSRFEYELTAVRSEYGTVDQSVSCSLRVTSSGYGKGQDNGFTSSSINTSWSGSMPGRVKSAYLGGFVTASKPTSYNLSMHSSFGDTFNGSIQELRYYANALSSSTLINHSLAPEMYSSNTGDNSYNELLLRLKLTEKKNHWSGSAGLSSHSASINIESAQPNQLKGIYWDTSKNHTVSGTAFNFPNFANYGFVEQYSYIDTPELGPNNYTSNKIRIEENKLMRHLSSDSRGEKPSSDKYALDSNNVGIYFSPTDQINNDIFNHIGGQRLDNFIGDPQEANSDSYSGLRILNNSYWKKYTGDNNKATYLNELKQYDMSMFTMINKHLPARANSTLGVIIEPHFLERSKVISRGKLSISGDTKPQNIALNAKSFAKATQLTDIKTAKPQVMQTGFAIQSQVITAKLNQVTVTPTSNALLNSISATPQTLAPIATQAPATTVIQAIIQTPSGGPIFRLSNENKNSVANGTQAVTQINASNVPSHLNNKSSDGTNGGIKVTRKSQGSTYKSKSLFKQVTAGVVAVAKIKFTGQPQNDNISIDITDASGTKKNYIAGQSQVLNSNKFTRNNSDVAVIAASLRDCINNAAGHNGTLTAVSTLGVVTITNTVVGESGNTIITTTAANNSSAVIMSNTTITQQFIGGKNKVNYIKVATPDYIASASIKHISQYNLSEARMTNVYHYYSASLEYKAGLLAHGSAKLRDGNISASLGKSYENGSSVNLFAYSRSLKPAQVSDYNLDNRRYQGTQISAADFNINGLDDSSEPVVSFTIGDPNILINSDAGFGGNITIE